MAIDVVWDNDEKTIMRFIRHPGWTIEDYYASVDKAVAMMKDLDHKVDVIQDTTLAHEMPPNALTHFRNGNTRLAPYSRNSVIVGDDRFVQAIFSLFKKLNMEMGSHFTIIPTVEEAHAKLQEMAAAEA